MAKKKPSISVIIPTYNGGSMLVQLLQALKAQTLKYQELIVIDSSSTDNSLKVAKAAKARTKTIPQADFDHGGTRALGAKMARGDILVFLTQDALPNDSLALENLVKALQTTDNTAAAYGRQLPHHNATPFAAHLRAFNYPPDPAIKDIGDKGLYGIKTAFLSDTFSAYKKSALKKIGWFIPDLILGEDTCAGAKLLMEGYAIAYAADAVVRHSHNYTIRQEFKRYFDTGVFHQTQKWLLKEFGGASGEGLKFVRSEFRYLAAKGRPNLLFSSFIRSGMKLLGYRLGRAWKILPRGLVRAFSMHKSWWDKNRGRA